MNIANRQTNTTKSDCYTRREIQIYNVVGRNPGCLKQNVIRFDVIVELEKTKERRKRERGGEIDIKYKW